MRFQVAADLKLDHFSHILELREHVIIEVQELLVGFLFAVLQACIGVIVVPSALLHPKRCKHAISESARSCFTVEWTISSIFLHYS